MMSNLSTITEMKLPSSGAAVDKTLGYGVDSIFRQNAPQSDPWGEECLSKLMDAVFNHDSVCCLAPTQQAVSSREIDMPMIFRDFIERGLLSKDLHHQSADDLKEDINYDDSNFNAFCSKVKEKAKCWKDFDDFHVSLRKTHDMAIPGTVSHAGREVATRYGTQLDMLSTFIDIERDEIDYLFDVVLRTFQYEKIAAVSELVYHHHPIRNGFGSQAAQNVKAEPVITLGKILLYLLKKSNMIYDRAVVLSCVEKILSNVRSEGISIQNLYYIDPKERKDVITSLLWSCPELYRNVDVKDRVKDIRSSGILVARG